MPLLKRRGGTWGSLLGGVIINPGGLPATFSGVVTATVGTSSNPRDLLVYGTYKPDITTTGILSGTILTDYNTPTTNTVTLPEGTVISNKTIYGDITPTGNVSLNNCRLVGSGVIASSNTGVLNCTGNRTGILTATDCEISPRKETSVRDCALGKQFELYRCYIHGGIDGVGIYAKAGSASPNCNVVVAGCYITDRAYFMPDYQNGVSGATWHADGSHNDGIQIQGGLNIHILGNHIENTSHSDPAAQANPSYPWLDAAGEANGQGITVSNGQLTGIDNSLLIEQNWFSHGKAQISVAANLTYIFRNNQHYRAVAVGASLSGYWIRFAQRAGMTVGGLSTNTWVDGPYAGTVLTEPRDHGIQFDA